MRQTFDEPTNYGLRQLTFPIPRDVVYDLEDGGNPPIGYVRCVTIYDRDISKCNDNEHVNSIILECRPDVCDLIQELAKHNTMTCYHVGMFLN